jgi:hypothetical protein
MRHRTRSSRVVAALAILAVVAAGCGDEQPVAQESSSTVESATSSTAVTPDELPLFPAPSLKSVGLEVPADCPLPWLPVYAQSVQSYPVAEPLTEVPPDEGTPIDTSTRRLQPPDSDGDGSPDQILEGVDDGRSLGLRRGDGELILAAEGASIGAFGGSPWVGDLDGDGRDELLVYLANREEFEDQIYVVPGSVLAGRHDPRTVAVRLPVGPDQPVVPIGDVDGDGADDLVIAGSSQQLVVFSGPSVMGADGGTFDAETTPIASLPDDVRGVAFLGDRPVPVVASAVDDDSGATELTLLTAPPIVLRTDRVPGVVEGQVSAFLTDGQRYVKLATQMDRSGSSVQFMWNLDDPCAGPTPAG